MDHLAFFLRENFRIETGEKKTGDLVCRKLKIDGSFG